MVIVMLKAMLMVKSTDLKMVSVMEIVMLTDLLTQIKTDSVTARVTD
jgi:hypothetical protein